MTAGFWDQRYKEHEAVYGYHPNKFLKLFIDLHHPGSILLPAEGEGRNAVYAAAKGWKVDAFDYSVVARNKALSLAEKSGLSINYFTEQIEQFNAEKQYDVVALIYVHLPPELRKRFHQEILKSIKPGGFLVLEAFSKDQLNYHSGGPSDESLLYDTKMLCADFAGLQIVNCEQKIVQLDEGQFHNGKASVIRLTGQKQNQ